MTIYYFDGSQVVEEKTTSGIILAQYLWGNGLVRCNGEYPLTDGRANIRLSTNASQQVISTNQPDAYGESSVTSGTASAYSYGGAVGYRQDGFAPAGLPTAYAFQKVGARYYDPAFGAFLTRDTDLSQSAFGYCGGDPVNCSDPTGHMSAVNIASGGVPISGGMDPGNAIGSNRDWANAASSSSSSSSSGGNSLDGTGKATASTTKQGSTTTTSLTVSVNLGRTTLTDTFTASVAPIKTSFGNVAGIGYNFGGGWSAMATYTDPFGGKPASVTGGVTYTWHIHV